MRSAVTAEAAEWAEPPLAAVARAVPTATAVAVAWLLAWARHGSIAASDWLGPAILLTFLLVAVLLSGTSVRPSRAALAAIGALLGLACWAGVSTAWSPVPALARDEALLTALYAIVFAVALLTLRSTESRLAALAILAAGGATLSLATAVHLRFGSGVLDDYTGSGRLYYFPISYGNAQAAFVLTSLWPSLALAARRSTPIAWRALALGGATACVAGWLLTQSRGGAVGLFLSTIVVFAVARNRLRLLVPTLIVAALAAIGFSTLTGPFGRHDQALVDAIRAAGAGVLWLTAAAAAAGAVYAFADRRLHVSERARRLAATAALVGLLGGIAAGVAAFLVSVDSPGHFFSRQWSSFKHYPTHERGSHFASAGSNRYDFWRVALDEFREHPVWGTGARGFQSAYLQERSSGETPARAHSIELELLAEDGLVGFALFAVAIGVPLAAAVRGARAGRVPATAALGGGVYWLAHASVDWTWTFPSLGIPFFLLLGVGAAAEGAGWIRTRASAATAAVTAAVAVFAFGPPWLSARLTDRAASAADPAADLRWAKRLDPLDTDPYLTEYALATTPAARIAALRAALEREPMSVGIHYLLGITELGAGRRAEARADLATAHRLDPRDPTIAAALRRAGG